MRTNILDKQLMMNYKTEFERIKRNPFGLPKKAELEKLKMEIIGVIHEDPIKILNRDLFSNSVKLINDIDEEIKKA